jgi:hypothetical protein
MFDVQKGMARLALLGLGAALLTGVASAQTAPKKKQPTYHRETNASREARIQRTIAETYAHRWEVFGGGGYMRFKSGDTNKRNNEVTWNVSTSYFLNPKVSIIGDTRGMFGHAYAAQPLFDAAVPRPQINEYTFMGGMGYRFYRTEKFAAGVQGLVGAGWGIFSGGAKGHTSVEVGLWPDATRTAFGVSLPLDYNFYPNLAFRVLPTYTGTTFGGGVQNNLGFNMGVVYRFGKQK